MGVKEAEKSLKRFLKRKMSYSLSLLVTFMITGAISFGATETVKEIKQERTKLSKKIVVEKGDISTRLLENENEIKEYNKNLFDLIQKADFYSKPVWESNQVFFNFHFNHSGHGKDNTNKEFSKALEYFRNKYSNSGSSSGGGSGSGITMSAAELSRMLRSAGGIGVENDVFQEEITLAANVRPVRPKIPNIQPNIVVGGVTTPHIDGINIVENINPEIVINMKEPKTITPKKPSVPNRVIDPVNPDAEPFSDFGWGFMEAAAGNAMSVVNIGQTIEIYQNPTDGKWYEKGYWNEQGKPSTWKKKDAKPTFYSMVDNMNINKGTFYSGVTLDKNGNVDETKIGTSTAGRIGADGTVVETYNGRGYTLTDSQKNEIINNLNTDIKFDRRHLSLVNNFNGRWNYTPLNSKPSNFIMKIEGGKYYVAGDVNNNNAPAYVSGHLDTNVTGTEVFHLAGDTNIKNVEAHLYGKSAFINAESNRGGKTMVEKATIDVHGDDNTIFNIVGTGPRQDANIEVFPDSQASELQGSQYSTSFIGDAKIKVDTRKNTTFAIKDFAGGLRIKNNESMIYNGASNIGVSVLTWVPNKANYIGDVYKDVKETEKIRVNNSDNIIDKDKKDIYIWHVGDGLNGWEPFKAEYIVRDENGKIKLGANGYVMVEIAGKQKEGNISLSNIIGSSNPGKFITIEDVADIITTGGIKGFDAAKGWGTRVNYYDGWSNPSFDGHIQAAGEFTLEQIEEIRAQTDPVKKKELIEKYTKLNYTPFIKVNPDKPIETYGDENIGVYFGKQLSKEKKYNTGIFQGEAELYLKVGEKLTAEGGTEQTEKGNLPECPTYHVPTGYTKDFVDGNVGVFAESGQREGVSVTELYKGYGKDAHGDNEVKDKEMAFYEKDPIKNLAFDKFKISFGKYSKDGYMFLAKNGTVIEINNTNGQTEFSDGIDGEKTNEEDASTSTIIAYAEGTWTKGETGLTEVTGANIEGKPTEIRINQNLDMVSKDGIAFFGSKGGKVTFNGYKADKIKPHVEAHGKNSIIAYAEEGGSVEITGDIKAINHAIGHDDEGNTFQNTGLFAKDGGKITLTGDGNIRGIGALAVGDSTNNKRSTINIVESNFTVNGSKKINRVQPFANINDSVGFVALDNAEISFKAAAGKTVTVNYSGESVPFYAGDKSNIVFDGKTTLNIFSGGIFAGDKNNYSAIVDRDKKYSGMGNLTINLKGDGINLGILEGDGSYTDDMEWNATTNKQKLIEGFLEKIRNARFVKAINATDAAGNTHIFNIGLRKMDFNVTGDGIYTTIDLDSQDEQFNHIVMEAMKVKLDDKSIVKSEQGNGLLMASSKGFTSNADTGYVNDGKIEITGGNKNSVATYVGYGHITNNNEISIDNGFGAVGVNGSKLENSGKISVTDGIGILGLTHREYKDDRSMERADYGTDEKIAAGTLGADKTIEIVNSGTVSLGAGGIGIYARNNDDKVSADNTFVTNSGDITVGDSSEDKVSMGIYADKVTLTNSGTISVGAGGIGIYAKDSKTEIGRDSKITITGNNGTGIYVTGASDNLTIDAGSKISSDGERNNGIIIDKATGIAAVDLGNIKLGEGSIGAVIRETKNSVTPTDPITVNGTVKVGDSLVGDSLEDKISIGVAATKGSDVDLSGVDITTGAKGIGVFVKNNEDGTLISKAKIDLSKITVGAEGIYALGRKGTTLDIDGKNSEKEVAGGMGIYSDEANLTINNVKLKVTNGGLGIYATKAFTGTGTNEIIVEGGNEKRAIGAYFKDITAGLTAPAITQSSDNTLGLQLENVGGTTTVDSITLGNGNKQIGVNSINSNVTITNGIRIGNGDNNYGISAKNSEITNTEITVGDSKVDERSIGAILNNSKYTGNGDLTVGKNSIGIFGKELKNKEISQTGDIIVDESAVGIYGAGSGKITVAGDTTLKNNALGVYSKGMDVDVTGDIETGKNSSAGIVSIGNGNIDFKGAITVADKDKTGSIGIYKKGNNANSSITVDNKDWNVGENGFGIFVEDSENVTINNNSNMTLGLSGVGVYSDGVNTVNQNGNIKVGKTRVTEDSDGVTKLENSVGIYAANGTKVRTDNSSVIDVEEANSIGIYGEGKGTDITLNGTINADNGGIAVLVKDGAIATNLGTITLGGTGDNIGMAAYSGATIDNKGTINVNSGTGLVTGPSGHILNEGTINVTGSGKMVDRSKVGPSVEKYGIKIDTGVNGEPIVTIDGNYTSIGGTLKTEAAMRLDGAFVNVLEENNGMPVFEAKSVEGIVNILPNFATTGDGVSYEIENFINTATSLNTDKIIPVVSPLYLGKLIGDDLVMVKRSYNSLTPTDRFKNMELGLDNILETGKGQTESARILMGMNKDLSTVYQQYGEKAFSQEAGRNFAEIRGDIYATIQDRMQNINETFDKSFVELNTSYNNTREVDKYSIIYTDGDYKNNTLGIDDYDYKTRGILYMRDEENLKFGSKGGYTLGFTHTDFNFDDGGSKEEVYSLRAGVFANRLLSDEHRVELVSRFDLGYNRHRAKRKVELINGTFTNKGSYNTYNVQFDNKVSKDLIKNFSTDVAVYGAAKLEYGYIQRFHEKGNLNLEIKKNDYLSAEGIVGIEGHHKLYTKDDFIIKSLGDIRYVHEFGENYDGNKARLHESNVGYYDLVSPEKREYAVIGTVGIGLEKANQYGVNFEVTVKDQSHKDKRDVSYSVRFNYKW